MNREPRNRKDMRLKHCDYSQTGYYFVTICTHVRYENILCEIVPVTSERPATEGRPYGAAVPPVGGGLCAAPLPSNHAAPLPSNHAAPLPPNCAAPLPPNHAAPLSSNHAAPLSPNHAAPLPSNHAAPLSPNYAAPLPPYRTSPLPSHLDPPLPQLTPSVILTNLGQFVNASINQIPTINPGVVVDIYTIMPDHIHMVLNLTGRHGGRPLPNIIGRFKSYTDHCYRKSGAPLGPYFWQRGYHDHIIRNDADLQATREYIQNNPLKWILDRTEPNGQEKNVE